MSELLTIRNLQTTFQVYKSTVCAVRGIDLTLSNGEILAVVGESGSGKSVSMKSLMGILPENAAVTADEMTFDGRNLLQQNAEERRQMRGREMAMIFQDPMTALNPVRRIGKNLTEVIMRYQKVSKEEAYQKAIESLNKVGIPSPEERMKQYPHEFSGGMRQRVMIAMALCCSPKLLIADEPTTALDVTIQAQILELLVELRRSEGMSIILITHDLGVVANVADRIAVMYGGLIMENGLTDEIFYHPRHPYTRALLRAIPKPVTGPKERLVAIPGMAPSLLDPVPGCPFQDRCSFAAGRCAEAMPDFIRYTQTQQARCFFSSEELDAAAGREGGTDQ